MANDITGNPLIIDTVMTTPITTKTFTAYMIRYVGPSTVAGDQVSVQDKNSKVKWATVASGSNYVEGSQFVKKHLIFEGLYVPTLVTGTVYVYVLDAVPIRT